MLGVGLIDQDPAPGYDPEGLHLEAPTLTGLLHLAVAGVGALSSVAGMAVMASRFAGFQAWRGWVAYPLVMAAAMVGCTTVHAIWSIQPTGWAGTFERAAILIPGLWAATLLRRLSSGEAFVVIR